MHNCNICRVLYYDNDFIAISIKGKANGYSFKPIKLEMCTECFLHFRDVMEKLSKSEVTENV